MKQARVYIASLALLAALGCKHIPTEKEKRGAEIHYDLGVQAQQAGEVPSAMREIQQSIDLDPGFAEARNAMGVLLHLSFHRPEQAIEQYKRALEIRPTFSEAKTNLANVYLDLGRYDEAIALYQDALNDTLYLTPYIAQNNLGWAQYKRGNTKEAVENIKAAVTTKPEFCQGYRNLGIIEEEQGKSREACAQFAKFREHCPESGEAYYREGVCLAKVGDNEGAKKSLAGCQAKSHSDSMKDDCQRLLERLQ